MSHSEQEGISIFLINMNDKLEGYVEHIIFRNEENGYTVFELGKEKEPICCTGILHNINEGEYLELTGSYIMHNIYGKQFKITNYIIKIPKEQQALERYLGSGAIKGIGAALASRIIKSFGEDTLHIIETEPERLAEIKGISEKKAKDIAAQIIEKSQFQSEMIFLSGYGISLNLCLKIHNKYHDRIYDILQDNPYKLAEEIEGIGFKIADSIALKAGIRLNSPYRIKSGFLYVLFLALGQGHMYLPKNILFARTAELLNISEDELDKHFMDLIIEKKIVVKKHEEQLSNELETIVYSYKNYYLELNTASMLKSLNVVKEEDYDFIHKIIDNIEKESNIRLDKLQKEAVEKAALNGVFILTGGPGTGKTTTINSMIRYFEALNMSILLAAPTGRAAKRMQEATGYESSTIHRMLELYGDPEDPEQKARFGRNKDNPLETDVIIIDETSMLDIFLMHALLEAVLPGTRIIFVGDINQLPSVGPGRVLNDMITSDQFAVVRLNKIFRQAAKSDIVVNAHLINAGKSIRLDNHSDDFFFLKRDDVRVIQKVVVSLVKEKLPKLLNMSSRDIQVLTPMRKGALGAINLNILLQKYINPYDASKPEYDNGHTVFRVGDKVMQIKNNYQLEWVINGKHDIPVKYGSGVFNGDMGYIKNVDKFLEIVTIEFDDSRISEYSFKQLDELELAYAITVHKAQGSEYPAIVMPLLSGPSMLMTRNLLYTAVTRAKSCVVLTGNPELVDTMIENETEDERYTSLQNRLLEFI